MDLNNLEEESTGQRKKQQITILAKNYFKKQSRNRQFKITKDNKPRVNLKYLVYYILLWIVYIDNLYNIHLALKKKQQRYLIRIYWSQNNQKYYNTKYIYRWHATKK